MADQLADLIKRCEGAGAEEQHLVIQGALMVAKNNGWIDYDTWDQALRMLAVGAHESAALLLVPEGYWYVFGAGKASLREPLYGAQIRQPSLEEPWLLSEAEHPESLALALTAACLKAQQARMEKES